MESLRHLTQLVGANLTPPGLVFLSSIVPSCSSRNVFLTLPLTFGARADKILIL